MRKIAAVATALALLSFSAAADPGGKLHRGNGQGEDYGGRDEATSPNGDVATVLITAAERSLIQAYYRDHPAMVDTGRLPPGIRKNLARGKPLPPGIAKKMPDQLATRLPPRPGYAYQVVGADVVLVEMATGVIVDMLRDALR